MPIKRKELQAVTHEPSLNQVRKALKAALYSPDPWEQAEGAAKLESWDLPISPVALPIAVRRLAVEAEIIPLTLAGA
jgi:hypothetical protein